MQERSSIFIVLALFVASLAVSRATRRISLAAALILGAYVAWDNLMTEVELPTSAFETEEATATIFGTPGIAPAVRVSVQVFNSTAIELESIDVTTSLLDCPMQASAACEVIGRKRTRIQLLAPPHVARREDAWVYFSNIPKPRGVIKASARVISGIGDRG